jgi:GNAT superfamily N-acetyltransferase
VRPAHPDEGGALREICIAAKAHWGYEREQVERWAAAGDFSPSGIESKKTFVADESGRPVGWASLIADPEVCVLDDMWVEPGRIEQGVGTLLFQHALDLARRAGARRLEWEAEPNAVGFYEKMGGRFVRHSPPTVFHRRIPVMGIDVGESVPPATQ